MRRTRVMKECSNRFPRGCDPFGQLEKGNAGSGNEIENAASIHGSCSPCALVQQERCAIFAMMGAWANKGHEVSS